MLVESGANEREWKETAPQRMNAVDHSRHVLTIVDVRRFRVENLPVTNVSTQSMYPHNH